MSEPITFAVYGADKPFDFTRCLTGICDRVWKKHDHIRTGLEKKISPLDAFRKPARRHGVGSRDNNEARIASRFHGRLNLLHHFFLRNDVLDSFMVVHSFRINLVFYVNRNSASALKFSHCPHYMQRFSKTSPCIYNDRNAHSSRDIATSPSDFGKTQ